MTAPPAPPHMLMLAHHFLWWANIMYNQNSMRRKQQTHKVERASIVDSANNLSNSLVSPNWLHFFFFLISRRKNSNTNFQKNQIQSIIIERSAYFWLHKRTGQIGRLCWRLCWHVGPPRATQIVRVGLDWPSVVVDGRYYIFDRIRIYAEQIDERVDILCLQPPTIPQIPSIQMCVCLGCWLAHITFFIEQMMSASSASSYFWLM